MSSLSILKQQKRAVISPRYRTDNVKGFTQVFTTLAPLAALWFGAVLSAGFSLWLTAGVTLLMSLYLIRAFVLMHECGHGSLFRTAWLNRALGFVFGVLAGNLNTPEVQALDREWSPKLAEAIDAVNFNAPLFERIASVYEARETSWQSADSGSRPSQPPTWEKPSCSCSTKISRSRSKSTRSCVAP